MSIKLPSLRLTRLGASVGTLVAAALIALLSAWGAVVAVERLSLTEVERALLLGGQDWANVETDGLQVIVSGTAPDETARFKALSAASGEVDSSRVIDHMEVLAAQEITPPRFSIEILRSESGVSMIGLIPAATDREALNARVAGLGESKVTDLLETADYPVPELWGGALDFALKALETLPRAKISMQADRVAVEAIADSAAQKKQWEQALARAAPGGVRVALDIAAPRPVVSPFTLRFTIDQAGARFDACTAHNEAGRAQIIAAAVEAGVAGRPDCVIGLGVPSPDWPVAVVRGIAAVRELGGGSLTFADADVSLVAAAGTAQATFDKVVGELETDLPDVFSLHAILPDPVAIDGSGETAGVPEFVATLSVDGQVQLRGRVSDEQERDVATSFARARFGVDKVYAAMRIDPDLPRGWSVRTLAAIEALSLVSQGIVVVQPTVLDITGKTGDAQASGEISRLLSEKLGEAQDFRVNVTYDEALDPVAAQPAPAECAASVNQVLTGAKIVFAPGSANIEASSGATVDKIAEILKSCPDVAMEVGGHTDAQGGEEMNKALSQRRADAVLAALLARRVLTTNLTAHGYGEETPIASNDTEDGREANRRIEFSLVGVSAAAEEAPDVAAEAGAAAGAQAAPAETEGAAPPARPGDAPATTDATDTATAPLVVDPDLAGKRPQPRPER